MLAAQFFGSPVAEASSDSLPASYDLPYGFGRHCVRAVCVRWTSDRRYRGCVPRLSLSKTSRGLRVSDCKSWKNNGTTRCT